MKSWFLGMMLVCEGTVYGQPIIFGTVSNDASGLANVVVTVLDDGTPIDSTRTNNVGYFVFDCVVLIPEKEYEIKVNAHCYSCPTTHLILDDTAHVTLGEISFSCMKFMDCYKADNSVYFDKHDAKTILNFETELVKELMTEYPTMVIQFSVYQFPDEKERLGKKRLKSFEKLLKKENLDLTRIEINPEVHYYRADQLLKSQLKPGIFGIVKGF
ncbi:MAG: carboxypeptidase regulatory-like domain-containing protein [Flavobacteriia bacterium]|nr:carboxypeptidase regulatory-like domain-containing protein [Flavobacteriia bacterium]